MKSSTKPSLKSSIVAVALGAFASTAFAKVHIEDAWVRATVPQQRATAVFMKITSDQPMRLVDVNSPAAPHAEVHEMKMNGSVMTMRPVIGVDIVPGQVTALTPSGHHIMLLELEQQVKVGDKVPVTLVFEGKDSKRTSVEVSATARALGSTGAAPMQPMSPASR